MKSRRGMLLTGALAGVLSVVAGSVVYSHCQIPCGIYGDETRFDVLAEHITTIEKSINQIVELSAADKPNMNQIVRWVNNKEAHADELTEIVTYYFMAQRIKPAEPTDKAAHDRYVHQLTLLHRMMVEAMKAKQTTDLQHVQNLRGLLSAFEKAYMDHEHGHTH